MCSSFNHYLLDSDIVSLYQTEDIHARCHSAGGNGGRMRCVPTNDDAPRDINHLQRALAVDDDVAIADEGKIPTGFASVPACGKHQTKSRSIVRRLGSEGVRGWSLSLSKGQQVHIRASQVVNQVQIVEFHVLRIEGNGVFAILRGLEIDGNLVCRDVARNVCTDVNVGHGIFLSALRDADVGAWIAEMELAQLLSLAEAHNGVVDGGR